MGKRIKRAIESDETYLKGAFQDFIEAKTANNLAEATLQNYETTFSIFWNDNGFTDETTCSEISEKTVYKWINHMKNKELSVQSINHYLRDTRTFLNWCMEREYIEPFKIKLLAAQDEGVKFFTEEELEALIAKPPRKDDYVEWRTWCIVNVILATGARAQTICDMRIEDINFSTKEITYQHTKNKKAQKVPLSQSCETVLKEFMRMYRPHATGWLFPNYMDEKLTRNALRLSFERYCKEREVSHCNIHGLRHSFSRGWILNNGNTLALKNVLGHSSTAMTSRYVKLFGQDLKEGYENFSVLDQMKKNKSRKKKIDKI